MKESGSQRVIIKTENSTHKLTTDEVYLFKSSNWSVF